MMVSRDHKESKVSKAQRVILEQPESMDRMALKGYRVFKGRLGHLERREIKEIPETKDHKESRGFKALPVQQSDMSFVLKRQARVQLQMGRPYIGVGCLLPQAPRQTGGESTFRRQGP
jgi:hypothetical protein